MKLGIISWNIRHLRPEKVSEYLDDIIPHLVVGRLVLLYENKATNNKNNELCDLLADSMADWLDDANVEFTAMPVDVGTNENVVAVWTSECKTGPRSKFPNADIRIDVDHNSTWDAQLERDGWRAIRSSTNETVMANVQQNKADFRIPAVLDVTIRRGDGTRRLRVAAWHAPGPATGLPPLMWRAFQNVLGNQVDLYVGDFNMTGLGQQTAQAITLMRTYQSTTITSDGMVNHDEGLDLVYRNALRVGDATTQVNAMNGLIGRATVSVRNTANFARAYKVSDHLPVYIEIKGL